jgi:hypothetical protein
MQYTQVRYLSQGSLLVVPAGNALRMIAAGVEELGTRVWARAFHFTRWWPVVGLGLMLLLPGCSASGGSSGGTNITLGLAGSTADRPSAPPTVAQGGPDATYAFVYDDQIWVHQTGNSTPTQITHLVLSNGADITFGHLVWSPDGKQIAFALVEDLTPSAPGQTAGPIYVVDISTGKTVVTPGIGSIYGHNYSWYGPRMLFYSSGDGISMYDIGDPDPRVWQVVSAITPQDQTHTTFTNNNVSFGDISITNNFDLFYGLAEISSPGGSGAIGTAGVYETRLFSLDLYNNVYDNNVQNSPVTISEWLYSQFPYQGSQVAALGQAYSDTVGNISMGSWQVTAGESKMVRQMTDTIDIKGKTVSSHFCASSFAASFSVCQPVLSDARTCSQSLHGQLTLSSDGSHMAYTCDTLYVSATSGGGDSKLTSIGWVTPAAMTADGRITIATQIVSSSKDSNGVLRIQTNLVAFDGTNSYVLIKGAQSASLQ